MQALEKNIEQLYHSGQLKEAVEKCESLIQDYPFHYTGYLFKAHILSSTDSFYESLYLFNKAIFMCLNSVFRDEVGKIYNDIGKLYSERNQFDESKLYHVLAMEHDQDEERQAVYGYNLSRNLLLLGEYESGWELFNNLYLGNPELQKDFEEELWDGEEEEISDKVLFIHNERRIGDLICFMRLLPKLKGKFKQIKLEVPLGVKWILDRCEYKEYVSYVEMSEKKPEFDLHVHLMQLCKIFNYNPSTEIQKFPYIHDDYDNTERWKDKLPKDKFLIAINWCGHPESENEKNRRLPLDMFKKLLVNDNIKLVVVQKFIGLDDLKFWDQKDRILDFSNELDNGTNRAFMDTMSIMKLSNLVVTCDTSIVDIAGAMGLKVFLPLPYNPDWRWGLKSDKSNLYFNVTLYRQSEKNRWDDVFEQMSEDVLKLIDYNKSDDTGS